MKPLTILFLSAILVGVCRSAFSAGPVGPPEGFANDDRPVAVGAGYFRFETEWKPKDESAFPSDIKLGQNIGFLQAGHLIFEAGEIFLRVGAADLKETDGAFAGNFVPTASAGLKGLWIGDARRWRRSGFGFGPILQGTYHQRYEEDGIPLGIGETADVKIEKYWDASLALGFQYRLTEKFLVFGGPFGYYSQADVRLSSSSLGELSSKFQAKTCLGGYAGARFTPSRRWMVEAEGQYLSNFSGGVTLIYTF